MRLILSRKRGFTLFGLVVAVCLLGAATALAIPELMEVRREAIAARVANDADLIRSACRRYLYENGSFPESRDTGEVPMDLAPFLSPEVSFTITSSPSLSYELHPLTTTVSDASGADRRVDLLCMTIRTEDRALLLCIDRAMPEAACVEDGGYAMVLLDSFERP